MNCYEEKFFIPGKTYDNYVFFGCDSKFIAKAKNCLKNTKSSIPSVCVEFSNIDANHLTPFLERYTDKSQQVIIARTLVNTKIFNAFSKAIENRNLNVSPTFLKLKNIVAKGLDIFNNEAVDSFVNYYMSTPLLSSMLTHQLGHSHHFELNIFEENMDNQLIQKNINSYLGGRTPYSIKLFTTANNFCSNVNEGGNLVEAVHDYRAEVPFPLSNDEKNFDE